MPSRVAIVGGGISGCALAKRLPSSQFEVTIFEKSRGLGGRLATRTWSSHTHFDHGAASFHLTDLRVREMLDGASLAWWGGESHYVGVPKMNQVCKQLVLGLIPPERIVLNARVEHIQKDPADGRWTLVTSSHDEHSGFDWVVLTCPYSQARELAPQELKRDIVEWNGMRAQMSPMYSLMFTLKSTSTSNECQMVCDHPIINWIGFDDTKPGRAVDGLQHVVAHSSVRYAQDHLEAQEEEKKTIETTMLHATLELLGRDAKDVVASALHKWRFANANVDITKGSGSSLIRTSERIMAIGDWTHNNPTEARASSVEAAVLTALTGAEAIVQTPQTKPKI